ncbi:hypothetical protein P3C58_19005 [Mesorhizobium sp. XAP10]|uniref:hypothetical protein n=1 Tax=unclassified Mesorhizobium TaxID=325217 RepID=UPI0023E01D19|nr:MULTISPECIES: hypothetical protein [unclassified Mesorhizobium]MDF3154071.1 hypothetical protein [Mesorhizobium sp. XAP10]MDF3247160.1 hypothetical protein [Mesorhizobium sp. XAP4]
METAFSSWSAPLVACVSEDGEPLSPWLASKFFEMRCSAPREAVDLPPDELEMASDALYWDFLGSCDLQHLAMLEKKEADTELTIARLVTRGNEMLAQADAYIADMRRWLRAVNPDEKRRIAVDEQIALIESKQDEAGRWLREKIKSVRDSTEGFEAEVMDSLTDYGDVEHLYTVRWIARHLRDRKEAAPKTLPAFLTPDPHLAPVYVKRTVEPFRRVRWRGAVQSDGCFSAAEKVSTPRKSTRKASLLLPGKAPNLMAGEVPQIADGPKAAQERPPMKAQLPRKKLPGKKKLSDEFREKRRIWEERKKKFNGQKTEA